MIAGFRQFLSDLAGGRAPERFSENDHRLAAAALLYHAVAIDGSVSDAESRFTLDPAATDALMAAAQEAEGEAVDLYGFTSVLKRELEEADRERIVEMMWELVFADGELHEFEDNLIWRVAELLGISSQTRLRLKQSVRGAGAAETERPKQP